MENVIDFTWAKMMIQLKRAKEMALSDSDEDEVQRYHKARREAKKDVKSRLNNDFNTDL